jgi:hypothetical protein
VGATRLPAPPSAPPSPLDPEPEPLPEPEFGEPLALLDSELELPPALDLEPELLALVDPGPDSELLPLGEDPQFAARVSAAPVATSFATVTARLMMCIPSS